MGIAYTDCKMPLEKAVVRRLFDDADAAFRSGDYTESTILLDSLQKGFPEEIAIQREALALRPNPVTFNHTGSLHPFKHRLELFHH